MFLPLIKKKLSWGADAKTSLSLNKIFCPPPSHSLVFYAPGEDIFKGEEKSFVHFGSDYAPHENISDPPPKKFPSSETNPGHASA